MMMESARIALSHVKKILSQEKGKLYPSANPQDKSGKKELLTAREWFQQHDIHLHIPAGAVPKDGPSAGITMATAMLSLITGKIAANDTAMTGELSLVGKVLPVGGIKEKVLAAKRAGIRTIILPKLNAKDLKEIPAEQKKGMKFHFVSKAKEVFPLALR